MNRREFVTRLWQLGVVAVGAAAVWTSWDFLQPTSPVGFGGKFTVGPVDQIPTDSVLPVPTARAYLTRNGDEVIALWSRCTHLGCRVPWCESAGEFECPCHGTTFNRVGEHRNGPAPRGLDRFEVMVEGDQVVIDTGVIITGPPLGSESVDEPPGPPCAAEGEA